MDVMDAIYGRRSVRAYTDKPLDRNVIEDLLGAAVQAPSAHNTQPWSFMLIQDRNRLESLSAEAKAHLLSEYGDNPLMDPYRDLLTGEAFDIFYGAPLLVTFCARAEPLNPVEQCFLATQNLMLAAHALGLGTCCIGWALPFLRQPEVKTELGIPEAVTPALPIIVGWPHETPEPTPRDPPRILAWLD
jgi:nitroreductase